MVNCIVVGNTSGEEGGGTCNAEGGSVFNMHNVLLAGNLASGAGSLDDGGGHFNRETGVTNMINCTVVKNLAGGDAGGLGNRDANSDLIVRNCIVWGNEDSGEVTLDAQLSYFTDAPAGTEVDSNVIEACTSGTCFPGTGTNKGDDPDVLNTTTGLTWVNKSYDAINGLTTFTMTVAVTGSTNQRLFKPEAGSPLQLLIQAVDESADLVFCYGNWPNPPGGTKTGVIYDYHIASGSSAIDYGAVGHLPSDDDFCDLDGQITSPDRIPYDLDGNTREQGNPPLPDSGSYEIE